MTIFDAMKVEGSQQSQCYRAAWDDLVSRLDAHGCGGLLLVTVWSEGNGRMTMLSAGVKKPLSKLMLCSDAQAELTAYTLLQLEVDGQKPLRGMKGFFMRLLLWWIGRKR